METDVEKLLEPASAYEKYYKQKFFENANEFFDSLVSKSGISIEKNRKASEEYRRVSEEAGKLKKKLSALRALKVFLIIVAIVSVIVSIYGIFQKEALTIIIPLLIFGGSLALIFALLNPKIKKLKTEFEEADEKAKAFYNEAMRIISPLLDLFESSMTIDLIEKTVPTFVFDKFFDMKRYDCLHGKYGYTEDDGDEVSTVDMMSGEIVGNPFIFERRLNHVMGTQEYFGSKTIHWTTVEVENGKRYTKHHSQVLHASVTKPKPFYSYSTDLAYGNEAAPDLSFSRVKTHFETLSDSKRKSFISSRTKYIKKLAKENIDKGFTELGNEEFDALFGAYDRNHEVQFRLLFTPLAQRNFLTLFKDGSPYGDDFNFYKNNCINIVESEHSQNREFSIDVRQYHTYDIDYCRRAFVELNEDYFCSIYFDFAPLLSIPMYQQIKPHEYIYSDNYDRNYTVREAEIMANRLGDRVLAHPASVTPAILKTNLLSSEKGIDRVSVHAFSYRTVRRVDFVSVHGDDGYWHDVPVPWLLYIPLEQETQIQLSTLDLSEREYRHSDYSNDSSKHTFYQSVFVTLGNISRSEDSAPDEEDEDISEFGEIKEALKDEE